ncbi:MAG: helix-turn-helix domain-containing protein [Clostridiales bacterium]|nr:helix-turn-helix domain-containing protein [Clostridiales bacterium]
MKNMLAKRLSEWLQENRTSQRELARNIHVSAMIVSDWTRGLAQPTAENIYLIAEYTRVSADYLLGLSDTKSKK